jgi:hypothetical protein
MLHSLRCLVLQVLDKVEYGVTRLHELISNVLHPLGNRGREQKHLQVRCAGALDSVHDLLNVLFEAQVEHLISFVENSILKHSEVKVASLHMVHDSASCTDENIDSTSKLISLIVHTDASVHCQNIKFPIIEFESV